MVHHSEQDRLLHDRMQAFNMADNFTDAIRGKIEHALSANYVLAALLRQGNGQIDDFEKIATQMLPLYPGVSSLDLSPAGIISDNVPLQENAKSIGLNLLKYPQQSKEAIMARDSGQLTLAGPLNLVQGGMAVVGRLPVFLHTNETKPFFWGFTNVVIRIPQVFDSIDLQGLLNKGYVYELWRIDPNTQKKQIIIASSSAKPESPEIKTMKLANTTWYFAIAPIAGWFNPAVLGFKILLAFCLSSLLAYLAKLMLELKIHKQTLEEQVSARTQDAVSTKNQLLATLDAIPDLLFEVGLDGRYYRFHSPQTHLLATPSADFIGKTFAEVLPANVAETCMFAVQEANVAGISQGQTYELLLPLGKRHFELSVSRKVVDVDEDPRFIMLARDITKRMQAIEKLSESEVELRTLADGGQALIWASDTENLCTYFNKVWLEFTGHSLEQQLGNAWLDHLHPDDVPVCQQFFADAFNQRIPFSVEYRLRRHDGIYRWMQDDGRPRFNAHSDFIGFIGHCLDITERKNAEQAIKRLSSIYAVLSQCNQAIVRCSNKEELFRQICRDAIRFGGFKMVWIGLADPETGAIKPVAYAGDGAEYLDNISINIHENSPFGRGPIGTAMRENRPLWIQDFMHDPSCAPWYERASKFGWRSIASLPINENGIVVASFNLYSPVLNAFDEAVCDLLTEMAMDISFALKNFSLEAARKNADEALRASEQHLRTLVETEPECVKLLDAQGQLLEMNAAGLALLEVDTLEEAKRSNMLDLVLPAYQSAFSDLQKRVMLGETVTLEFELVGMKGTHRWLETRTAPMRDQQGNVVSLLGVTRDITVRKHTDDALKRHTERLEQAEKNAKLGSWEFDVASGQGWWSRQMFQMFGFEPSPEPPGFDAYLECIHPEDRDFVQEVLARMRLGEVPECREFRSNPALGTIRYFMPTLCIEADAHGNVLKFTGTQHDITQQKLAEEHILKLANYDALTGLPNRTLLTDRINHAISAAQRNKEPLTLMFLDLDHFKNVNDSLGHRIGDDLLICLAERLREIVREEDTISRLGGDEFILVLSATNADGAAHVADKLLHTIARPYQIEQYELVITPSIGIAMYPNDGEDFETLSKCADTAMYRAKAGGRNTYCFFTPEMQERSVQTLQLENALRHAIEGNQLRLEYQPQISIHNGKLIGAEALVRWQHPEFGLILPGDFISLAENTGQIMQVGEWVLRTACQQLKAWMDSGFAPMTMAVNLSAVQFRHLQLPESVSQIVQDAGVQSQYLELELTESVAMDNPLAAVTMMDKLHARGIRMSIDDFGTGYSSLSYLKRFQVYKLKIDRSFVRDITHDPEDKAIVCAIINLAKSLGLQTIAEGVETREQLEFLQRQGCDEVQGYYFSQPLPAAAFEILMREHKDSWIENRVL